jgi:general stress protein CsbA
MALRQQKRAGKTPALVIVVFFCKPDFNAWQTDIIKKLMIKISYIQYYFRATFVLQPVRTKLDDIMSK